MSRINTNVSSLSAQARLQRTNKDLQQSLTRLSTGLRINSGADDPAGLIASEALRSDITSLNKALTNTQRASQIIATADSALGQVSSLLNDIRGLVVEAANNGALSDDEIAQTNCKLTALLKLSTVFRKRRLSKVASCLMVAWTSPQLVEPTSLVFRTLRSTRQTWEQQVR